jgi:hypothetical protein
MQTYSKAADKSLNGQGKPILAWMESEIQRLNS